MMQRDQKVFLCVFLACVTLLMISACATYSADKAYLAALEQFNMEARRYDAYYEAATPEDQAVYKVEIDPLILKASKALEAWGLARKFGSAEAEMDGYLDAKNAMIDALVNAYGKDK